MSKLGYILSILCLIAYSYADDGCMDENACNWVPSATLDDGSCEGAPGIISDIEVVVNAGENSVLISWSRPCGLGNIFAYTLLGDFDPGGEELSISSPYYLENLSWSTIYNLEISTSSEYGEPSYTPFEFSIGPENIPSQITALTAEPGEASVALSWYPEDYSSTYIIYLDGNPLYTTLDNIPNTVVSGLNTNTYFEFQVSGLNSEGNEGERSEPLEESPLSIPPVADIQSSPGLGEVTFSWSLPSSYANDNDYTFMIFDELDELIEESYDDSSYTITDLQTNEQRCIKVAALHQFGVSAVSDQFCESSSILPPTEVEGLSLIAGEGYISLEWDDHPDANYYFIYRDGNLITEAPLLFWGSGSYDDINLQANTEYEYVVIALNTNGVPGAEHDPVSETVLPLPVIEDLEILPGSGRALLSWSAPSDYAGFGYSYEIHDSSGLVKSTNFNDTFIPNLEQPEVCCNLNPIPDYCNCNEYCYTIKSVSLGEYGSSNASEESCIIPQTPYGDGSGEDELNLEWGIQIIAELESFSEDIPNEIDEYNLIGVSEIATDGYDDAFDVPDSPNPNSQFFLFFPHVEWGNPFNDNFSQDIRSNIGLPDTVIVWSAELATEIAGRPYLTFYFNNITDTTTVYASYYDSSNNQQKKFQKIEDGDTIDLETIFSGEGSDLEIIVGQAIPDPPTNLGGSGGYREISITWDDSCCQPGLQQYPAESYNIWRGGVLVGREINGNTFTDRGWHCFNGANNTYIDHVGGTLTDEELEAYECTVPLEPGTLYTYQVSAINPAGESARSNQIFELSTLENRAPFSKVGMDITVYDLQENNQDGTLITLPIYSDFSNQNQSYDLDNSYNQDGSIYLYTEPLDSLEFKWTSASNSVNIDPELTIAIEGYGEKGFELEVGDGRGLFSIDSVFVSYLAAPAPAIVDSVDFTVGLYDIELHFLESMFTGESYADLNNNLIWDEKESFQDCGFDNLCPSDLNYVDYDQGEQNGIWDFEDLNQNGWLDFDDLNGDGIWDPGEGERFEQWSDEDNDGFWDDDEPFIDEPNDNGLYNNDYDGGSRPRPPFYGLPSNLGDDNIATKYIIRRNGIDYKEFSADSSLYLDPSEDGDLYIEYTLLDSLLSPSTEYCYQILACNFNDDCTDSEEVCMVTRDSPTVSILSPNGEEILGNATLDVELILENSDTIESIKIELSYDGEFNADQTISDEFEYNLPLADGIDTLSLDFDLLDFPGYTNNAKIKAIITDEGGFSISNADGNQFPDYSDESDYQFIISENRIDYDFDAGWHLFGTPIGLENSDFYTVINDLGIGLNWNAIDQNGTWVDGVTGDVGDLSLSSGEGFYFWLLSPRNIELSGELLNPFHIPLEQGWNLISNPLIETLNMGALDLLRANGEILSMTEAISLGLISSRMLGFNNSIASHEPTFEFEPFMGYWVFAYESGDSLKVQYKLNPELISEPDESSDWRIKLSARAYGAGQGFYNPLGDMVNLGFSDGASDGFRAGEDEYHIPFTSNFSEYTYLKIDNSDWVSENEELYSEYFSQDIQSYRDTSYVWNIIGESGSIGNNIYNEYEEIVLSWEMNELSEDYSIFLYVGADSLNMRDQPYQVTILEEDFESMRVEVKMVSDYTSGCSDETACNYYCNTNIDCDESGAIPQPFYDNETCEYESCTGCSDDYASNYNPNFAEVDTSNCLYLQSFLLRPNKNIYPESEIENRMPVNLHNYDSENIFGIEIQLAIDPEKIIVSDIDISTGIFANESISINDSGIDTDYSFIWGYTSEARDTLGIVIYSSADPENPEGPINPEGISKIFDLVLEVTGEIGEQVTIDFVKSDLNTAEVNVNSQKLSIVKGLFQVGGMVQYYSNQDAAVDDTKIDLVGISEFTTLDTAYNDFSDLSGSILFPAVLRGDYLGVISKEDNSMNGLSAVDASRIARHSVGLIDFNNDEKYIADVDLNGYINAFDASAIARFLVGNVASLNQDDLSWSFIPKNQNLFTLFDQSFISRLFDGMQESVADFEYPLDWVFNPSLIDMDILTDTEVLIDALQNEDEAYVNDVLKVDALSSVVENLTDQEIVGYKIGDVDGDWWSDIVNLAKESDPESYNISIAKNESSLHLPLTIEGKNLVEGIDLDLSFDPEIFNLNEFEIISSTLTEDNYQTVLSEHEDGISLVIYCTSDVKNHDGILANLTFEILSALTEDAHIDISKFRVNGVPDESAGFRVVDGDSFVVAQSISFTSREIPDEYLLGQNYPNPFNPSTNIPFALPFESEVKVNIYDVRGRLVQELVNSYFRPGYHHIAWEASHLSSGLYFIQFESTSLENNKTFSTIQKSLLVK